MSVSRLVLERPASSGGAAGPEIDSPAPQSYECDRCRRCFQGAPSGAGLFIWTRGDEVRYEEPPLCEECAGRIAIGALLKWDFEEEEG